MYQKKYPSSTEPYQNNPDVEDSETSVLDEVIDDTPKPKKKPKTKEFYVNEKDFKAEIEKYYATSVFTPELADMIRKMLNGLAHRPNFINYTFRDEAIGDGLLNIMAALTKRKYNPEKSKPFSYFNAIAWNCWRNRIKKEAKFRNALAAYQEENYGEMMGQEGCDNKDE